MDWNLVKEISEPLKNYAEAAALLGAGFAWWKWSRERHDHATEVLFKLEKTFANPKLKESRLSIEDGTHYGSIAQVLAKCAFARHQRRVQFQSPPRRILLGWAILTNFCVFMCFCTAFAKHDRFRK